MRNVWAIGPVAMLAACGSSEPPAVEFDRPASAVYNTLSAVDGRVDLQGLLKSPAVSRGQPSRDTLVFELGADNAEHRGRIVFAFEALGAERTRVTVDAELPEIEAEIAGQAKLLSEAKVERELARRLGALAKRMSNGGLPVSEIDALDQAIAFTALAMDPNEVNRALALSKDMGALAAAIEHEAEWRRDDASEWDQAGAEMDIARGADTSGDDPSPDGDWGAPTE